MTSEYSKVDDEGLIRFRAGPLSEKVLGCIYVALSEKAFFNRLVAKGLLTQGDKPNIFRLSEQGRQRLQDIIDTEARRFPNLRMREEERVALVHAKRRSA